MFVWTALLNNPYSEIEVEGSSIFLLHILTR
jgi:hypothetical protein